MEDDFGCDNQINFVRTSYVTVGSILKGGILFLPTEKKKEGQCLLIGDTRGVIYKTKYKKVEPEIIFKTNPYPKEIRNFIEVKQEKKKDAKEKNNIQAYYSSGNSIYSMDENPQEQYKIEFDIVDDIKCFYYIENIFWIGCNHYLSCYEIMDKTVAKGNYDNISGILSVYATNMFGHDSPFCILGSEDNKIKCLEFINNEPHLFSTMITKGGVTCITQYLKTLLDNTKNSFIFGTKSGSHGVFTIKDKETGGIIDYELNAKKGYSDVVNIKIFDINNDKNNEIILIRSDGLLEIYTIGDNFEESLLICKYSTNEHLTGIDIGKFKLPEKNEIVLTSLSGLVFGLAPELKKEEKKKKSLSSKELKKETAVLTSDINGLRDIIKKKQEEFKKSESTQNQIGRNIFKVEYDFSLNTTEKVFCLTIDSEFPIEMMIMHCSKVELAIIEIKTKDIILNIIDEDSLDKETKSHTKFMATLKPKGATHRIEIILRTFEGPNDTLTLTIIPNNKPKTAQIITVPIYALSFHVKYEPDLKTEDQIEQGESKEEIVDLSDQSIVNTITVNGLTFREINQILHLIIPNFPSELKDDSIVYYMKSALMNTVVEITVDGAKNMATIRTPYLSTLIILKEQITNEANKWKKEVIFDSKVNNLSIFKMLELFHPKIEEIFKLELKYKTLIAFKELGDGIDIKELPEEYMQILNQSDEINSLYEKRTINLKYYINLVEQLLLDIRKVVSVENFEEKMDQVKDLFNDYSFEKMKKIFSFLE